MNKPCPFCPDGKAIPNTKSEEGDRYNCSSPGCYLGEPWREYGVHIENWNTRPIEDAQAECITELKEMVRELRGKMIVPAHTQIGIAKSGEYVRCLACQKAYPADNPRHTDDCSWEKSGELLKVGE